jgi:hypothetical protein
MLLAALLVAAVLSAPDTHETLRPRLLVQMDVEPGTGLSPDDLKAVAAGVQQIWAPAVDVSVVPAGVSRTVAVATIALTVTTRTLPATDTIGLGWIDFVNGEPQPAVTVSVAAARRLLAGSWAGVPFSSLPKRVSRTFLQRALARAIAHEIGHYLLRSRTHEPRGLMRAVFSVDEIMDGRQALVRLSDDAIARLRDRASLLAKNGAPSAVAR